MPHRVAWLFPAFAMRSRELTRSGLEGYESLVADYVQRAEAVVRLDASKFSDPEGVVLDDDLEDDLQAQYTCYIDNCAMGKYWEQRYRRCDYVAGYSMGMFAALHHSGAVSFEDGLRLMREICIYAHDAAGDGEFGMGTTVGPRTEEVRKLIASVGAKSVEIADICGPRVTIFAGMQREVEAVLEACEVAGALHVRLIPVRLPFHSRLLKSVESRTKELVGKLSVHAPRCGIVSSITQGVLTTASDVRDEVIRNVAHPMNWYETMQKLLALDVNLFLESGFSESLTNLAVRNVKGKYSIYNLRHAGRLLAAVG